MVMSLGLSNFTSFSMPSVSDIHVLRHSSRHRTRPSIPHRGDGEGFEANEMGIRLIHGLLFARHVSDQLV
jgi:hypothetical protein